jgi:hypothetical protein
LHGAAEDAIRDAGFVEVRGDGETIGAGADDDDRVPDFLIGTSTH